VAARLAVEILAIVARCCGSAPAGKLRGIEARLLQLAPEHLQPPGDRFSLRRPPARLTPRAVAVGARGAAASAGEQRDDPIEKPISTRSSRPRLGSPRCPAAYLAAQRQLARQSRAAADVNAKPVALALEMLGRELQQGGLLSRAVFPPGRPAARVDDRRYFNGKAGRHKAFDSGLHGCRRRKLRPRDDDVWSEPRQRRPTRSFNRFAEPSRPLDCNRRPVSNDADNAARWPHGCRLHLESLRRSRPSRRRMPRASTARPARSPATATATSRAVSSAATAGVEDLVIRYGLHSGTSGSQSPEQFLSANGVDAQPMVNGVGPWQRVTAVKLCVLVRSMAAVRVSDKAARKPNSAIAEAPS